MSDRRTAPEIHRMAIVFWSPFSASDHHPCREGDDKPEGTEPGVEGRTTRLVDERANLDAEDLPAVNTAAESESASSGD